MFTAKDDKLEKFLSRIKESKNSNNKLLNYKKAIARLDELKTEYNNLGKALKPSKKNKEKLDDKLSMEKIISGLDKINAELDNEATDMLDLIDKYIQYRLLLEDLETENESFKNEIMKVEQTRGNISISKIDPGDIL